MPSSLETKNLNKFYGQLHALKDFSFEAKKGDIIALLGPNGAGKSTMMNIIAGFLSPSSGRVIVCGKDFYDNPIEAKKNIGFLPEGAPLYPDMTVSRFLQYMAEIYGYKKERINEVAALTNIENVMHQKIETLSKGYARRVGFAQSIIADPQILLLDEPTDGLDPNQKDHIRSIIKSMGQQKTIVISTHLLEEAETLCNRIVLISSGEKTADGTLQEILAQTKTKNIHDAFVKLTKATAKSEE